MRRGLGIGLRHTQRSDNRYCISQTTSSMNLQQLVSVAVVPHLFNKFVIAMCGVVLQIFSITSGTTFNGPMKC